MSGNFVTHRHRTLNGRYICITDTDCQFHSDDPALTDACNGSAKGLANQDRLPIVQASFFCTVSDCENDGYPVREDYPNRMIRLEVADSIQRAIRNKEVAQQGQ